METESYIDYLKFKKPQIWASIKNAAQEGLIYIDEANDAVTATNRLLLTYPDLHEVLSMLNDTWARETAAKTGKDLFSELLTGIK